MDDIRGLPEEYAPQLRHARSGLTVADEIGLALREHRRLLGLSQRAYAQARGLSRAMLARLEAGAGRMSVDTVVDALAGTGFVLQVGFSSDDPDPNPTPSPAALQAAQAGGAARVADVGPGAGVPRRGVPADAWAPSDLVARVRGDGRRFPAHRRVRAVTDPPLWWWLHEFLTGPTEKPKWYAPAPRMSFLLDHPRDDETGAA